MLKLSVLVVLALFIFSSSLSSASPVASNADGGNIFGYDPKRSGARGFHEGIFDEGFGGFSTLKKRSNALRSKRRPEMTSKGIHGDAFTGGFGDFYTMKRSAAANLADNFNLAKFLTYLENEQMRSQY